MKYVILYYFELIKKLWDKIISNWLKILLGLIIPTASTFIIEWYFGIPHIKSILTLIIIGSLWFLYLFFALILNLIVFIPISIYVKQKKDIEGYESVRGGKIPIVAVQDEKIEKNGMTLFPIKIVNQSEKCDLSCSFVVDSLRNLDQFGKSVTVKNQNLSWLINGERTIENFIDLRMFVPEKLIIASHDIYGSYLEGVNSTNTDLDKNNRYLLKLKIICPGYVQNGLEIEFNCLKDGNIKFSRINSSPTVISGFGDLQLGVPTVRIKAKINTTRQNIIKNWKKIKDRFVTKE